VKVRNLISSKQVRDGKLGGAREGESLGDTQ